MYLVGFVHSVDLSLGLVNGSESRRDSKAKENMYSVLRMFIFMYKCERKNIQ